MSVTASAQLQLSRGPRRAPQCTHRQQVFVARCGGSWGGSSAAFLQHPRACVSWARSRDDIRGPAPLSATSADATSAQPPEPLTSATEELVQFVVRGVPWKRLISYATLLVLSYALAPFFGLAATAYILSYIGNSIISIGESRFPGRRRALTLMWYTTVILLITGFGLVTVPSVTREGAELVARMQSENPYVIVGDKIREFLGDALSSKLERFLGLLSASSSSAAQLQPEAFLEYAAQQGSADALQLQAPVLGAWSAERAADLGRRGVAGAMGLTRSPAFPDRSLQTALEGHTTLAAKSIAAGLAATTRLTLQGIMAIILSFMIVWDLPTVTRGLRALQASRLGFIYDELAPPIGAFGGLFGKALQAQCGVAIVNTALTALGMAVLNIPGVAVLSLIVFFFSFIPVAGVICSTVPIGFVALTEYGMGRLFGVILMVVGVHAVEAYLLNPIIYAAHLKLHPLIVLSVLVVAEHSLGVWGLLLAVPATVFVIEFVIKTPSQRTEGQLGSISKPRGGTGGGLAAAQQPE